MQRGVDRGLDRDVRREQRADTDGNHLWSKRFGNNAQQEAHAVAIDPAGNIVVAGMFWGTIDFGGGALVNAGGTTTTDIYVAKLDAAGNHFWSARYGDNANQGARGVAVDAAGYVYVTGEGAGTVDFGGGPLTKIGESDAFLFALDDTGQYRWGKRWGRANVYDGGTSVTVDPSGNVLVTGYMQASTDIGTGPLPWLGAQDIFLGKFSSDGVPIYAHGFGSTMDDFASVVRTDATGNVLLTGYYMGPIDFGGGALAHTGNRDAFLVKLDASGSPLWSSGYGNWATGMGIAADSKGNVLTAGYFRNTIDFGGGPLAAAGGAFGSDDVYVAKLSP